MKIWLTTDTHFGHEKIKQYCGRPDGFERIILTNLVKSLTQEDILIHLGDFCIGNDEKWHDDFMSCVPWKKWLVLGNHDHKSKSWYLNHGWDFVAESFTYIYEGKKLLFSHTPVAIDESYHLQIHGHFHNTLHRLQQKQWISPDEEKRNEKDLAMLSPRHKLIALEYTDYKPVLLDHILK